MKKLLFLFAILPLAAAAQQYWHGKPRAMRYHPEGDEYVIVNGDKKFNRALYGTNTAFRVETGDLPEFGFYMPGMGGNVQLSISNSAQSKNLCDFARVEARYKAGRMTYRMSDPTFGKLTLDVLAMADAEGVLLQFSNAEVPANTKLTLQYGGASGKKFSRNGDLGVDPPDCFALKPGACKGNVYAVRGNEFSVTFSVGKNQFEMVGVAPANAQLRVVGADSAPMLSATWPLTAQTAYFALQNAKTGTLPAGAQLPDLFARAEAARAKTAQALHIHTPDEYINPIGGALAIAADGIWDGTAWQHGAVGWRMPLAGWRAAYVGDVLGWHDRARTHFDNYAASQVTNVPPIYPHPNQDTAMHLSRAVKKWGTQMYSNGYICRAPKRNDAMNHYDMNLAYIDELLWHFRYTGNIDAVRKFWPVIERHLAWEKRNFDPNNDGLYDAYCCIWASDALEYNSGGVTHSSAYNYYANVTAAQLAKMLGYDAQPYIAEAEKIRSAVQQKLWLNNLGWWAEYIDLMGAKRVHTSAALWTVYHAIDGHIGDAFQSYQATRYVDEHIPHIPIRAAGLDDTTFYALSTSTWMPYAWSINNVAFAETFHTALAYWLAGRADEAFRIFKGAILDGQYLGASPGNFGQISFYDAARGECYRDFGDPIGIASRALVQGLFGIQPDAMNGRIVIRPGYPKAWNHAQFETGDVSFAFVRNERGGNVYDTYTIGKSALDVQLRVRALRDRIASLRVNGSPAGYTLADDAIGEPEVIISAKGTINGSAKIEIEWSGKALQAPVGKGTVLRGKSWDVSAKQVLNVYDPQQILASPTKTGNSVSGIVKGAEGHRTLFLQLAQGDMKWWAPVDLEVANVAATTASDSRVVPPHPAPEKAFCVPMNNMLNASVTQIFKNEYLSPRSPYTTLQIPTQGIGEWCHPLETATINDSAMHALPGGVLKTPLGIPFCIAQGAKNIAFTTLWDNYPNAVTTPLPAKRARHAYLLLAGSTNPMQCHIANAVAWFEYTDGTRDSLVLTTPDTWAPIEQDYFADGYAFRLREPRPYRVHFKTGLVSRDLGTDLRIGSLTGGDLGGTSVLSRRIDGGAGLILDMPLNPAKTLKSFGLATLANDVVAGVMAVTVVE